MSGGSESSDQDSFLNSPFVGQFVQGAFFHWPSPKKMKYGKRGPVRKHHVESESNDKVQKKMMMLKLKTIIIGFIIRRSLYYYRF